MSETTNKFIDLNDVSVEEIQVLDQEGSRGVAEFAASTSDTCTGTCSCVVNKTITGTGTTAEPGGTTTVGGR
ncbi:MAG: hypothetical protein AAGD01_18085 [Acidobacteriota bacterium]